MTDSKNSSGEGLGSNDKKDSKLKPIGSIKNSRKPDKKNRSSDSEPGEVLFSVGGLKYKMPGQRQRVLIGSIVVGLNVLLVIAVIIYFYSPAFQEFIYHVGRDV